MANPQLIAYIKSQLSAGQTSEQISQALTASGYDAASISDALSASGVTSATGIGTTATGAATVGEAGAVGTAAGAAGGAAGGMSTGLIIGIIAVVLILVVAGGLMFTKGSFKGVETNLPSGDASNVETAEQSQIDNDLSSTDNVKWAVDLGDVGIEDILVAHDGTIFLNGHTGGELPGVIFALDPDGNTLWEKHFETELNLDVRIRVIDDMNTLYFSKTEKYVGQHGGSFKKPIIVALDGNTGDIKWEVDVREALGTCKGSGASLLNLNGDKLYVDVCGHMVVLSRDDGVKLFEQNFGELGSKLVDDDGNMYGVQEVSAGDAYVSYDSSGNQRWSNLLWNENDEKYVSASAGRSVFVKDMIYLPLTRKGGDGIDVVAVDKNTGETRWVTTVDLGGSLGGHSIFVDEYDKYWMTRVSGDVAVLNVLGELVMYETSAERRERLTDTSSTENSLRSGAEITLGTLVFAEDDKIYGHSQLVTLPSDIYNPIWAVKVFDRDLHLLDILDLPIRSPPMAFDGNVMYGDAQSNHGEFDDDTDLVAVELPYAICVACTHPISA